MKEKIYSRGIRHLREANGPKRGFTPNPNLCLVEEPSDPYLTLSCYMINFYPNCLIRTQGKIL